MRLFEREALERCSRVMGVQLAGESQASVGEGKDSLGGGFGTAAPAPVWNRHLNMSEKRPTGRGRN